MLPLFSTVLWILAFVCELILLAVLLKKAHYRSFPALTAMIAFDAAKDATLFFVQRYFSPHAYFVVYWSAVIPDYFLQLVLVYEITRNALLPHGRKTPRKAFIILGFFVLVSLLITAIVASHAKQGAPRWIENVIDTASLTLSLLRCLLFASITLFSNVLGLSWKNHLQRVATGLAIYSLVDFVVDYAYTVYQNTSLGRYLDYFRVVAFLISLAYWIRTLSLPEPERKPLAPQVEALVYRVHQAVIADRKILEGTKDRK